MASRQVTIPNREKPGALPVGSTPPQRSRPHRGRRRCGLSSCRSLSRWLRKESRSGRVGRSRGRRAWLRNRLRDGVVDLLVVNDMVQRFVDAHRGTRQVIVQCMMLDAMDCYDRRRLGAGRRGRRGLGRLADWGRRAGRGRAAHGDATSGDDNALQSGGHEDHRSECHRQCDCVPTSIHHESPFQQKSFRRQAP
jgi:hypothetical protein